MSLQQMYTETMDVFSETAGRGLTGGMVLSGTAKAAAQPCRVTDGGGGIVNFAGAKDMKSTHTIVTDYSGIANGDYVVVAGATYRVSNISQRRGIGSMAAFYVISAEEVSS
jgi:hypothetical protein